jgi:hypothetical protein
MMKTYLAGIGLLLLVGGGLTVAQNKSQNKAADVSLNSEVGRFLLFKSEYETLASSSVIKQFGIFKIDTVTGESWLFHPASTIGSEKSKFDYWQSIPSEDEISESLEFRKANNKK